MSILETLTFFVCVTIATTYFLNWLFNLSVTGSKSLDTTIANDLITFSLIPLTVWLLIRTSILSPVGQIGLSIIVGLIYLILVIATYNGVNKYGWKQYIKHLTTSLKLQRLIWWVYKNIIN
jgi:hypothetical protein